MIKNDQIINKFKNLETKDLKSFYGFWDMYKRTLTLRIFATAHFTKDGIQKLTHVKEVIRFAPNGLRDYENWHDRNTSEDHMGEVKDVLWENSLYYHNFTNLWRAALSNQDNQTLPINLNKKGKPYDRFNNPSFMRTSHWKTWEYDYFMRDRCKIYFQDITDYMQPKSILDKLKKIKLKDGKTNASIIELIDDKKQDLFNLYNYITLYKKYAGLKVIYDNKLFKHLKDSFLDVISSDEKYQKFYHQLILKDKKTAQALTKQNFKKAYQGVDVELENIYKNVKTVLTKLYKEANDIRKQIIDDVRVHLKEFKWLESYKFNKIVSIHDKVSHYIDYLVFKHEDRGGLTRAIYLSKNWEAEYNSIIAEIESVKAIEKQNKFIKENKRIAKIVEDMAEMIGIRETEIKNEQGLNKYIVRLPHDLIDYNTQGTQLVHCYKNNSEYLKSHNNLNKVLIFIEKDGIRYATATLHQNGKVTDFHLHKNIEVEGYEKYKLSQIIKEEIFPNIINLKNKNQKKEQLA